ncbi:MAG: glycosyltransferase [Infirmifilum sp.]
MNNNAHSTKKPLITICIPIKNRAWILDKLFRALESLEYPKINSKIVFVDGCSTDGTYEGILEWSKKAKELGFREVKIVRAESNIPQARNICIKYMEGKYLLYWDSDVIPPPELLREMIEAMERDSDIGIMGADYIYEPSTGINYVPVVSKKTNAVYMGFTLIRREVFEKVGMFNENLSQGEDTEFCIRVKEKTNYRILWAPKPVLHLKRSEEVRKPGRLRRWLWYNFTVRAKEYYVSWDSLPKFLKLRVIYWITWPWSLVLLTYSIFTGFLLMSVTLLIYVLASAYPIVRSRGIKGLKQWMLGNVPTGISLSYGFLREALVRTLKRIKVATKLP